MKWNKTSQINVFSGETTHVKLICFILLNDLTNVQIVLWWIRHSDIHTPSWKITYFPSMLIISFSPLYYTEATSFLSWLWKYHCVYLINLIQCFIVTSPGFLRVRREPPWPKSEIKFSSIANFLQDFIKSLNFLCSSSSPSLKWI